MVLLFSTSGQPVNRGKQKGENISLSLQVQNSEVACVTSTHISLARIQLHGHVWLQGNQKMQSLAGQLWAQLKLRLKEERTDNWRYWQSQPQIPCSGFISNYSFGAISGWMGVSSFSSLFRQDLGISSTCVLPSHTVCNRYNQAQQVQSGHNVMVNDLPYFLDYKMHSPPNLGGKWGCVLQSKCSLPGSLGVGGGQMVEWVFLPIFLLQNLGVSYGPVRLIVRKIRYMRAWSNHAKYPHICSNIPILDLQIMPQHKCVLASLGRMQPSKDLSATFLCQIITYELLGAERTQKGVKASHNGPDGACLGH